MILNSKSEFTQCYIPRLVVEIEDEEAKKNGLEKKYREVMNKVMEDMDLMWEQKKERDKELFAKKRVRMSESDGGQKPKRMKKMKYRLIGEEWGEGADERSIDALNIVEQGADSSSTPEELQDAGAKPTSHGEQGSKRPRDQACSTTVSPPPSVVPCDRNKRNKLGLSCAKLRQT